MLTLQRLRWTLSLLLTISLFLSVGPAWAKGERALEKAAQAAVSKACASLSKADLPGIRRMAVLPLDGDRDYAVTDLLKIAVTKETEYKVILREASEWEKLLGEIEWGARREDVMQPETVKRLGRILGVEALLYGKVKEYDIELHQARVAFNLHLANVETGQHIWGEVVTGTAMVSWRDIAFLYRRHILYGIGALIVLILIRGAWKRATTPR